MESDGTDEFSDLAATTVSNVEGTVLFTRSGGSAQHPWPVERLTQEWRWATLVNGDQTGGIYAYHPPLAQLVRVAKQLIAEVASRLGYEEHIFPRHYTERDLEAFGWTQRPELEPQLMKVAPRSVDDSLDRTNHHTLADPVQCIGFYASLSEIQRQLGGRLPSSLFADGPLCVYEEQGGWTLRNELASRLLGGWATAFEFGGAELVFAGTLSDVKAIRWRTLVEICELLDRLQMKFRLVVSASCARQTREETLAGIAMPIFDLPTIDIELFIPSDEGNGFWLELGGGDFAGEHLVTNYGLKCDDGVPLTSGCQGFGWQRFALGLLAQKGPDIASWPNEISTRLGGTLPEGRLARARSPILQKD